MDLLLAAAAVQIGSVGSGEQILKRAGITERENESVASD